VSVISIIVALIAGGFLTYYSWWLLLHASDERVKSSGRFFRLPGTSKEDEEAGRETEAALSAVVLMVMGSMLLIAGVCGIIAALQGD
jgi:hypothetical protein